MKTIAQQLNVKKFPFRIRDENVNIIYSVNNDGHWCKYEFDEKDNLIYWEHSNGTIMNNRPKPVVELTLEQIATKFGIDVNNLKIKK